MTTLSSFSDTHYHHEHKPKAEPRLEPLNVARATPTGAVSAAKSAGFIHAALTLRNPESVAELARL
jgi:hypothetical protein